MTKKLMFVAGADWHFISHRLAIAQAAMQDGYEVHLAAPLTLASSHLPELGIKTHSIPFDRGSINPLHEFLCCLLLLRLFLRVRPDIVHLITIKPILYGGIAARLAGVKSIVAAVAGLGFIFMSTGFVAKLRRIVVLFFYRLVFAKKNLTVIFQNPDDRKYMIRHTGLAAEKTTLIRGSGIDLVRYAYSPMPRDEQPIVCFIARLLRDKGIYEFIEAAKTLKQKGIVARFCLVGSPDKANPTSVSERTLQEWAADGIVEVWGHRTDIAAVLQQSMLSVLPSYREGLPRSLVEAAACGRAVITTDVPGCRDAIEAGKTGLLVPVKDAAALAAAMEQLLRNPEQCAAMGQAGRALAEEAFAINKIVDLHIKIYEQLAAANA